MASPATWLLFNSFLRLITKRTSKLYIPGSLWEKSKGEAVMSQSWDCDSAIGTKTFIGCLHNVLMIYIVDVVKIMNSKTSTVFIFYMRSLSVFSCNLKVTGRDRWSMIKVLEYTCYFIRHIVMGVIMYPVHCAKLTLTLTYLHYVWFPKLNLSSVIRSLPQKCFPVGLLSKLICIVL